MKYNKKVEIVIILFMILFAIIVGTIFINKNEKATKNNNSVNQNTVEENEEYENNKSQEVEILDFNLCFRGIESHCTKNNKNNTVVIKMKQENTDEVSRTTVSINGHMALDFNEVGSVLEKVYLMDDIVIVLTEGTYIGSTTIYIYDQYGTKLKEIYNLDNDMDGVKGNGLLSVDGSTIRFSGIRITDGICDFGNSYDYNLIQEGIYELNYLGNYQWSDIQTVSQKTIGEYIRESCQ